MRTKACTFTSNHSIGKQLRERRSAGCRLLGSAIRLERQRLKDRGRQPYRAARGSTKPVESWRRAVETGGASRKCNHGVRNAARRVIRLPFLRLSSSRLEPPVPQKHSPAPQFSTATAPRIDPRSRASLANDVVRSATAARPAAILASAETTHATSGAAARVMPPTFATDQRTWLRARRVEAARLAWRSELGSGSPCQLTGECNWLLTSHPLDCWSNSPNRRVGLSGATSWLDVRASTERDREYAIQILPVAAGLSRMRGPISSATFLCILIMSGGVFSWTSRPRRVCLADLAGQGPPSRLGGGYHEPNYCHSRSVRSGVLRRRAVPRVFRSRQYRHGGH